MPLSTALRGLTTNQLDMVMQRYLSATLALSTIKMPPTSERYKLFDPDRLSERRDGDWHQFLAAFCGTN